MENTRFNKRSQKPGESVDTFIQDLYRLAENCNYGTLKDDLIRYRIVVGVVDDSLSDRLQSKANLTLAGAVQMSHQAKSTAQNRDLVRSLVRSHVRSLVRSLRESVGTFIQDLYRLAENCNYGTLKDDLIRYRIVVEVVDDSLSDRLQSKANLTLAGAVQTSHQGKSTAQNRDLVRGDNKPVKVKFVNPGKIGNRKLPNKEPPKFAPSRRWCGRERHLRQVCRAKDATCVK